MDNSLFSFLQFQIIKIPLFVLTFVFIGMSTVIADTPTNQITAYRTYESIEIDGDLSEADWQKAEPINQFVQIEPHEGQKSSEPMEVHILYDDENIYLGFTCYDTDISKLVANEMRRDARDIHENDNVFVLLDTYNDNRSGFFFRANTH